MKSKMTSHDALVLDKNSDKIIDYDTEFLPIIRQVLGQFNWDADRKEMITNGKNLIFNAGEDEKINFDRVAVKQSGMPSAESLGVMEKARGSRLQEFRIEKYARKLYEWLNLGGWGDGWRPEYINNKTDNLPLYKLQDFIAQTNPNWIKMT